MNPDIFAEWLRRQGLRVIRTGSSYWADRGHGVYQAFPYHWTISPGNGELRELLIRNRAVGLRYSTPPSSLSGKKSYHVVWEAGCCSLESLPKKARHAVRCGLQVSRIGPVSFSRLAEEGWSLRADTLERQGRSRAENWSSWRRLCLSAERLPGFEAYAAEIAGELAAALIAFVDQSRPGQDCASILYQQSRTAYLSKGVNNALVFVYTESVLGRFPGAWLFYGLRSLDAPASVDEFKFHMGYVAKPVRQRVLFHPWLTPLFSPASHTALRLLLRCRPGSPSLAKAEGMLRFYLEGRV